MLGPLIRIGLLFTDGVGATICGLSTLIWYAAATVAVICGLVIVTTGPWDFLVWLFKADWRTTHFKASLDALGILIVATIIAGIFWRLAQLGKGLLEWSERIDK